MLRTVLPVVSGVGGVADVLLGPKYHGVTGELLVQGRARQTFQGEACCLHGAVQNIKHQKEII